MFYRTEPPPERMHKLLAQVAGGGGGLNRETYSRHEQYISRKRFAKDKVVSIHPSIEFEWMRGATRV